jgi:hypothetical protein
MNAQTEQISTYWTYPQAAALFDPVIFFFAS